MLARVMWQLSELSGSPQNLTLENRECQGYERATFPVHEQGRADLMFPFDLLSQLSDQAPNPTLLIVFDHERLHLTWRGRSRRCSVHPVPRHCN